MQESFRLDCVGYQTARAGIKGCGAQSVFRLWVFAPNRLGPPFWGLLRAGSRPAVALQN